MFLLVIVEFLIISTTCGKILDIGLPLTLGIIAVAAVYPIICVIKYLKNRSLTIFKIVAKDVILTYGIVVFNLLLINFACILIFGLDFSNQKDLKTKNSKIKLSCS